MKPPTLKSSWIGSNNAFIDSIHVDSLAHVAIGRFGGCSQAGQTKNEDGYLLWVNQEQGWEFAVLCDSHLTAESAELVIHSLVRQKSVLLDLFAQPLEQALTQFPVKLTAVFTEPSFLESCRNTAGETSCLLVLRKDKYLAWYSVGDCLGLLFHPELAHLGQFQLNQRQFYEWIGQVNTFEQPVPCYSHGVRELRTGTNRLFLTTDGLTECPNQPYANLNKLYHDVMRSTAEASLHHLLQTIQANHVRDSTTILAWDVQIIEQAAEPSNSFEEEVNRHC